MAARARSRSGETGRSSLLITDRWRRTSEVLAALGVVLAVCGTAPGQEADPRSSGVALARQGEFAAAVREYDRALAGDLSGRARAEILNFKGYALLRLDEVEAAVATLRTATTSDPAYALARYNLTLALWRSGQEAAAFEQVAAIGRLDPEWRTKLDSDPQFAELRADPRYVAPGSATVEGGEREPADGALSNSPTVATKCRAAGPDVAAEASAFYESEDRWARTTYLGRADEMDQLVRRLDRAYLACIERCVDRIDCEPLVVAAAPLVHTGLAFGEESVEIPWGKLRVFREIEVRDEAAGSWGEHVVPFPGRAAACRRYAKRADELSRWIAERLMGAIELGDEIEAVRATAAWPCETDVMKDCEGDVGLIELCAELPGRRMRLKAALDRRCDRAVADSLAAAQSVRAVVDGVLPGLRAVNLRIDFAETDSGLRAVEDVFRPCLELDDRCGDVEIEASEVAAAAETCAAAKAWLEERDFFFHWCGRSDDMCGIGWGMNAPTPTEVRPAATPTLRRWPTPTQRFERNWIPEPEPTSPSLELPHFPSQIDPEKFVQFLNREYGRVCRASLKGWWNRALKIDWTSETKVFNSMLVLALVGKAKEGLAASGVRYFKFPNDGGTYNVVDWHTGDKWSNDERAPYYPARR